MATSSEYRALIDQLTANTPTFSNSDTTNQLATALSNIESSQPGAFTQSNTTTNYQNQLGQIESSQPGAYESQYQSTIDGLMNKILNRESFSYDFNADPLYQNYKDQYTKLGKEASMNAAANASALTGGYGSSYATTAAAQANQQYLTRLNNIIPDLAEAAYTKYQDETNSLYNQFNVVNTADENAYNRYRDTVSDWQSNREYYQNAYQNSYANDYNQYRDTVSDWQANRDYYANRYENAYANDQTNYSNDLSKWSTQINAYQNNMDSAQEDEQNALAYQEWLAEMAYQQSRDSVSDNQWAAEYALSLANANKSGSSGSGSGTTEDSKQTIATLNTETKNNLLSSILDSVNYNGDAYASGAKVESAIEDLWKSGIISNGDVTELMNTYKYYATM